ncbi:DUF397 domain-containing protein [Kibdelosporangium persicum]|uniref:DUF397 domain-containing protein n=1 Tax=Kibdelosporangium persicum TaxID=2698649 RepID=UPI0015667F36|nr:DUF397 domain-containing protein [Kibdelosporangium persicum]
MDSKGHVWVKSSASGGDNTNCVEVAHDDTSILVRDSKDHGGRRLRLRFATWQTLLRQI